VASILPKHLNVSVAALDGMSDDELFDTLAAVRVLDHEVWKDWWEDKAISRGQTASEAFL
jgi:hypothetical protein